MADQWLSTALAAVKASGAVGRDRKRMEAAAFQASLRANGTSPACDSMVATLYEKEEVMRRARVALGVQCGMLGVGQLKERLASRGRRDLAARFAKLNGTRKLLASETEALPGGRDSYHFHDFRFDSIDGVRSLDNQCDVLAGQSFHDNVQPLC